MKDQIPGGLADNKDPKSFDQKAVAKGRKVEKEHTSSKSIASEIARDHLTEDPKYYDKLEKIEKKAFWIGFEKQARELTSRSRNSLPDASFALPGRRYPIHDKSHARNALARVSQHGTSDEKRRVQAAVHSKFPDIGED